MKKLIFLLLLAGAGFWFYSQNRPEKIVPVTELSVALEKARAEDKILFLLAGRENCPNCRTLRTFIEEGEVKLPSEKFVYADLNCDEPNQYREFSQRFSVEGRVLPFVIVADSVGRQFAARSGYGGPEEFTKLIDDAVAHIALGY